MLYLLLLPIAALSQTFNLEKIVVGSKRGLNQERFTDDVETLKDFENEKHRKVIDALRILPGVGITQNGPPGQQSSIFIRGSEARHVLVLIDGVRVNDPSNTEKFFNASLLNLSDVEKIEVLKGAQTLLYGSDAIGGVVNIITKKGSLKNSVSAFAGFSRGISFDKSVFLDNGLVHFTGYHEQSDGISAAASGDEEDGFENKGTTVNLSLELSSRWEGDWTYKVVDQFVETDALSLEDVPIDSYGDYSKSIQQVYSQKLAGDYGVWSISHLLGANKVDRANKAFGSVFSFEGFELTNELHFKKKNNDFAYLFGVENASESFEQTGLEKKSAGLTSAVFVADRFYSLGTLTYGLRGSYHTQYEEAFSPSVGFSRSLDFGQVSFNYRRGFKSPTLYQLYGPDIGTLAVGNPDLEPETSDYIDVNFKKGIFEVGVFYNKIEDYIQYDSSEGYVNAYWFETSGVEASALATFGSFELESGIFLANYHLPNGEKALRKPAEKATLRMNYAVAEGQIISADYIWRGESYDNVGGAFRRLAPFGVMNMAYQVNDAQAASAKIYIENAFNRSYETAYGYASQPFTFGMELKFNY